MPQKNLLVPLAVALTFLVVLTCVSWYFSDAFNSSAITASEFAERFEEVPKNLGSWVSQEREVTDEVRDTAGAVGHVSRTYLDQNTGRQVDLWLIVGHSRNIVRHTPDICYPSAGFTALGSQIKHQIKPKEGEPGMFYTAEFVKEDAMSRHKIRVFWSWNGNKEGQYGWKAPSSGGALADMIGIKGARAYYGNNTALYKMYFTTAVTEGEDEINDSPAIEFAKLMIPEVNKALFPERYGSSATPAEGIEEAEEASSEELLSQS